MTFSETTSGTIFFGGFFGWQGWLWMSWPPARERPLRMLGGGVGWGFFDIFLGYFSGFSSLVVSGVGF